MTIIPPDVRKKTCIIPEENVPKKNTLLQMTKDFPDKSAKHRRKEK